MDDNDEPLARLIGHLDAVGITRLADLTGMDRIGIPVVQAVRPLGLANAVTQGKGTTPEQAAVTAIMEAIEQFAAERVERFAFAITSAASLGIDPQLYGRHLLDDTPASWHEQPTAWMAADDLAGGGRSWVPLELVHTAYAEPGLASDGLFYGTTTGLAAGLDERLAAVHGILECIERDAIARAERTHGFFQRFGLVLPREHGSALDTLIAMIEEAGLVCAMWHAPSPTGIPVIWCQVMEDGRLPLITPYPADGFAADPDPIAAARRALVEAAQSRLAAIAGARDDIFRNAYPRHTDWVAIDAHRRMLREVPERIALDAMPRHPAVDGDPLDGLVEALRASRHGPVLQVRLDTAPLDDLVVLRMVIPALLPLRET